MAANPERSSHFPAIEKKHGLPMSHWFAVMKELEGHKYAEQVAYLRENHGFSRAHANALVLYSRGSTTSRRFETLEDYLMPLDAGTQGTIRAIFTILRKEVKGAEVVIAWNQPMLKRDGNYLFGVSAMKNHLLIAPFGTGIIEEFTDRLKGYKVNKKTIAVPLDWTPDAGLLRDLMAAQLRQTDR